MLFVVFRVLRAFFFFQAEDGIRDHCVTGVQTCALPSIVAAGHPGAPPTAPAPRRRAAVPPCDGVLTGDARVRRSEERRVGKECGYRWAAHHEEKENRGG